MAGSNPRRISQITSVAYADFQARFLDFCIKWDIHKGCDRVLSIYIVLFGEAQNSRLDLATGFLSTIVNWNGYFCR